MVENELPRVTDEEAKENLLNLICCSEEPLRMTQHLKDRVESGGINGRLHSKCIIALLAECFGVSVNSASSNPFVSLRVFRRGFLEVSPNPFDLLPIEIYCLNVRPEDTASTCRELQLIAECCEDADFLDRIAHKKTAMMVCID